MTVLLAEIDSDLRRADERGSERVSVKLGLWTTDRERRVLIYNLSQSGMLLRVERDFVVGEQIELELPEAGRVRANIVRIEELHLYGCEFELPISRAAVKAALLKGGYE